MQTSLIPASANIFTPSFSLRKQTWLGLPVQSYFGSLPDLRKWIPQFEVTPFSHGGTNDYQDLILRLPLPREVPAQPIPVGLVSKRYTLIQHHTVMDSLIEAVGKLNLAAATLPAALSVTAYQERMHVRVQVPGFDFNPGDRHPMVLVLNCFNSVDASLALEISTGWFRQVCSNGMRAVVDRSKLRRIHIGSVEPGAIADYLKAEFRLIPEERKLYLGWFRTEITTARMKDWVDGPIATKWGPHAAARVYSILLTGLDGRVGDKFTSKKPSEHSVQHEVKVPGSPTPTRNAFHASQALSWVAGRRGAVQSQLERLADIPTLMDKLVPQKDGLQSALFGLEPADAGP